MELTLSAGSLRGAIALAQAQNVKPLRATHHHGQWHVVINSDDFPIDRVIGTAYSSLPNEESDHAKSAEETPTLCLPRM